jgi:hypothetical protein
MLEVETPERAEDVADELVDDDDKGDEANLHSPRPMDFNKRHETSSIAYWRISRS